MGQKTHPIGLRLGIVKTWDSRWFAKRNYPELLKEDLLIKRYLKKRLYQAGISKITIERKGDKITVEQHIAEVGKAIGAKLAVTGFTRFEKGEGIEKKQDDFAAEIASLVK